MTEEPEKLESLGDYDILRTAASGGMGIVYKARQRSLGRVVALKVIREDIARSSEYRERFLREARLAASVDHPHVVSVYDAGEADSRLFLAMQWIDGEDLGRMIERFGWLSPERAVLIAVQLAGALDAVHSVGLVHRDVKPANVLLREVGAKDHAYLTDFGVAKTSEASERLTQTGALVGTAGYLSPEQITGREPDPRSDVYALGCVFFVAITGQPPFRAENETALRWAHVNEPRPAASDARPQLGTRYDEFLATALALDPEQRFASGSAFATALGHVHRGPDDPATQILSAPTRAATAVRNPTPPANASAPPAHTPPHYAGHDQTPLPPAPPQPRRSANALALILLGVALAGLAVGALAIGGVFTANRTRTQTITAAAHHGTSAAGPAKPPAPAAPGAQTSAGRSCGGDLSVGGNTTCAFAHNVEQAYAQSTGGETDVAASSPETGQTYTMHCTGGSPHVCTGANNASVYFSSGPSGSAGSSAPPRAGLSACDQNISAGPGTSCPFAENVFRAYAADYKSGGEHSSDTVNATSPATSKPYSMTCTTDGVRVNCSGANNAYVTFPLHAVEVY